MGDYQEYNPIDWGQVIGDSELPITDWTGSEWGTAIGDTATDWSWMENLWTDQEGNPITPPADWMNFGSQTMAPGEGELWEQGLTVDQIAQLRQEATAILSDPTVTIGGTKVSPADIQKITGSGGFLDKIAGAAVGGLKSLFSSGTTGSNLIDSLLKAAAGAGLGALSDIGKTDATPKVEQALKDPKIIQAAIDAVTRSGNIAGEISAERAAGLGLNQQQLDIINAGVVGGLADTTPETLTKAITDYTTKGADLNANQVAGQTAYNQALATGKVGTTALVGDLYGDTTDAFTKYLESMGVAPTARTDATALMRDALGAQSTINKANTLNLLPNYQGLSQNIMDVIGGGSGISKWSGNNPYISGMANAPGQYGNASQLMALATALGQNSGSITGIPGMFGNINDYVTSYLAADPTNPAMQEEAWKLRRDASGPIAQQEMLKSLEAIGPRYADSGVARMSLEKAWADEAIRAQQEDAAFREAQRVADINAQQGKAGTVANLGNLYKQIQDIYTNLYMTPVQKQAEVEKLIGDSLLTAKANQAQAQVGQQGVEAGAAGAYNSASVQAQQNAIQAAMQAPGALNTLTTGYENALIKPSTDLASYLNVLGQQELTQKQQEIATAQGLPTDIATLQAAYKAGLIDPDTAAALNLQNLGTTQYQGTQQQAALLPGLTSAYQTLSPTAQALNLSNLAGVADTSERANNAASRAAETAALAPVASIYSPYTTQYGVGEGQAEQSWLSKMLAGAAGSIGNAGLSELIKPTSTTATP